VFDSQDACPNTPGPTSNDPKQNGCPLNDQDGDGILDQDDACPSEKGVRTFDPKTNGCPRRDRDKDGVFDDEDACPDEPGPADTDPKKNGCPKAVVKENRIEINDQVRFKTNSAEILPGKESQDVLAAVAKILKDHPEIKSVRVEGHTDSRGNADHNRTLSGARAASVVKWLVKNGIDAGRLSSYGFGSDRPIADNGTEEGRQTNRRVEFHIESGAPAAPTEKK
jgi:outer membrane protein OmpA-like peptidoglycan-associated protein